MRASCVAAISCSALLLPAGGARLAAAEFHVSPQGTPAGAGSLDEPWDLTTALAHPATVQPGDTIWLHGGTYAGSYRSDLTGGEGSPIVVRQAKGERAIVDLQPSATLGATFNAYGAWTRFEGFEVTCSDPKRRTEQAGSWPTDIQRGSVECRGSHLQFINLLVHDLGSGFGCWSEAAGGEIYGCLIYNNGHGGPDRGHGHGIYAQNKESINRIADNILFQQFGFGIHAYGSEKAFLQGFRISGNAVFANGCLQGPGETSGGVLVGGGSAMDDVVIEENMVYNGGLQIGYSSEAANKSVIVRKNYAVGLRLYHQDRLVFEENTVIAGWPVLSVIQNEGDSMANHQLKGNVYFNTHPKHYPFFLLLGKERNGFFLDEWQARGFDAGARLYDGPPTETQVFVRPNQYESGRANVIVFNWAGQATVDLDHSNVLKRGRRFRIVGARNFYGPAVVRGVYRGAPVSLPMQPVAPAQPVGMLDYELPAIEPEFGAFVVLPD